MSDIEDVCAAMCDGMNGKAKLLLTGLSRVTIDVAERLSCDKELEKAGTINGNREKVMAAFE